MNRIKKILKVICRGYIKKLIYFNEDLYMSKYIKYLKSIGVKIIGEPKFISPDAYFDGKDYSVISIGDNTTISREVMLLTHDYSLTNAVSSQGDIIRRHQGELYILKDISIGNNVFIGARASVLPGTTIGDGTIVGAGAVVKGEIPPGVIVVGNPARVIGTVSDYAKKIMDSGEFIKDKVKQV